MTTGLEDTIVNASYDDELVTVILADLAKQAGWQVQCPESTLRLSAHPVYQTARQAIDNVCNAVGWFWRYGNAGSDTLTFAHKQETIKSYIASAEQAIRAACDYLDVVSALDEPENRDAWYGARHTVETGLGLLVTAKQEANGTDLVGRLFSNYTGKVTQ